MKVTLLQDSQLYQSKKGEIIEVPDDVGKFFISKGVALPINEVEKGIDKKAEDAIKIARNRDGAKE